QGQLPRRLDPWGATRKVAVEDHGSRAILESLVAGRLKRIEVRRKAPVVGAVAIVAQAGKHPLPALAGAYVLEVGTDVTALDRAAGDTWVMPGNWPTRPTEVRQLVDLLSSLRSRFEPIPLGEDELKKY